jgi:tetratricopeptide (TPR) repeat protein
VLAVSIAMMAGPLPGPGTARGQARSAADLFREGRALARAGQHAAACEKFIESQELDPQLGTLFNIAQCEEKIGKLASALAAYREVIARDRFAERRALADQYRSRLERRVPRLVVQIAAPPGDLVVRLDAPAASRPIAANRPIEVDLGAYTVTVRASGYRERSARVVVGAEGVTTTVPVALEPDRSGDEPVADPPHEPRPGAARSRRALVGTIGVAVGGAAVAAGIAFGAIASSKWSDAKSVCDGTTCATQAEVDRAQALASDARSAARTSTVLFATGAVVAATGVVLWLTAPRGAHEVHVTASALPGSTGLSVAGRF